MKLTVITNAMRVAYMKLNGCLPADYPADKAISAADNQRFLSDLMYRASLTREQAPLYARCLEYLPHQVRYMFGEVAVEETSNSVSILPTMPVFVEPSATPDEEPFVAPAEEAAEEEPEIPEEAPEVSEDTPVEPEPIVEPTPKRRGSK